MRISHAHTDRETPMPDQINASAPKKPTNLSVNSELLAAARELKINLSATLETALLHEVNEARRKRWLDENKAAIETCNEFIEKHGLFADKYRVL
jgi:antitoxin CcdA